MCTIWSFEIKGKWLFPTTEGLSFTYIHSYLVLRKLLKTLCRTLQSPQRFWQCRLLVIEGFRRWQSTVSPVCVSEETGSCEKPLNTPTVSSPSSQISNIQTLLDLSDWAGGLALLLAGTLWVQGQTASFCDWISALPATSWFVVQLDHWRIKRINETVLDSGQTLPFRTCCGFFYI